MITITHTHADGTLVDGTSKGDGTAEILRACRFRWFPSIKMWGIAQSRDHLAKRWQIDQAASQLRAAGFEVETSIDDTPRDVAEVKADRAERLDERAERLTAAAGRASAEANARLAAADRIAEGRPFGQPILVGHHSERRARADQRRIETNMHKFTEAYGKAKHYDQAAAVVGKADAYRERPGVTIRRIDKTEAELRQTMHRINGTRPANDWRGAYYAPEAKPADGAWLEQLQARKTFLEHQLEADRALLAEHVANGYVRHGRDTIHKGDTVHWSSRPGNSATVTRTNPKTVSLDRRSWPRTLPYEQIHKVECPHNPEPEPVPPPEPEPEPAPASMPEVTPTDELAARVSEWKQRDKSAPAVIVTNPERGYFPSPAPVVNALLGLALPAHYDTGRAAELTVLEPSAGHGAIAAGVAPFVAAVDCIEIEQVLADKIRAGGYARTVTTADFLTIEPRPEYDRVIMNPPFARGQDITHVMHALQFVKPGGRLVAVMSAGVMFRSDKATTAFRELVHARGWFEELPEESFNSSGTGIRTVIAVIPWVVPGDRRGIAGPGQGAMF